MTGNVLLNGGAATSENIPENVTIIGTDAMDSFVMEGTKLKRVVCPKGLRAIDAGALSKSTFEEIGLPETVDIIDNFAFYGCNNAKICIPKSVKTIGYEAFGRSFGDSDGFLDFSEYTPMKKMEVTFQEVPKNVDAFAVPSNITISFESGFGNAFTAMDVVTKGAKNYSDRLFFAKVKEASGYQIQMKNKKTEKTQTKTIKASDSTKVAQLKVPKKFKYNSTFKIRPYQSKDGKTVYGKWANGRNVPYEED